MLKVKTAQDFLQHVLGALEYREDFQGKYRWNINCINASHAEATTQVYTVAGWKTITLVCTEEFCCPMIILAAGVPANSVSDEVFNDVLLKMNDVNQACGNDVVAFIVPMVSETLGFYLRGRQAASCITAQANFFTEEIKESILTEALNSLTSFICVVEDTTHPTGLLDLFSSFN